MVVKEEQERVRALLADTITLLCRNGLTYKSEFNISALIGITLDKEDVLLVDIRETIKNNIEEENAAESSAESEEESPPSKRQRKRRKRKRSQNSNEEISLADKQFEPVNLKTELSEQDEDDIVFIKDEPGDSLDSSMDNSHHYKGQLQQQSFMSHYGNMSGTIAMPGTVNMSWDQSSQQQQQQQQNQSLLANASASNISTAAQVPLLPPPSVGPCLPGREDHAWRKKYKKKHEQQQQRLCGRHNAVTSKDLYICSHCGASECGDCRAADNAAVTLLLQSHQMKEKKADSQPRVRKWREEWKAEWYWLEHRDEKMYCSICCYYYSVDDNPGGKYQSKDGGPFVTGSNKFRKDCIKGHEQSSMHQVNVGRWETYMMEGGDPSVLESIPCCSQSDNSQAQAQEVKTEPVVDPENDLSLSRNSTEEIAVLEAITQAVREREETEEFGDMTEKDKSITENSSQPDATTSDTAKPTETANNFT